MNDAIQIFQPLKNKTTRGMVFNDWGTDTPSLEFPVQFTENGIAFSMSTLVLTIKADVQPKTFTEFELRNFGFNDMPSDAKTVYYRGQSVYFVNGNRALVNATKMYEIRNVQVWPSHVEILLVPVVGVENA